MSGDPGTPISETAPANADRRRDLLARIGQRTRFQSGNQARRKYPKPVNDTDPEVANEIVRRVEQHLTDRGGRELFTEAQIRRLYRYAVLELFLESWERYFLRAGIVTRQGRVRSGFASGYLATSTQLMRLGQIIGLDRVSRPVNRDLDEWLASDDEPNTATTDTPTSETNED